MDKTLKIGRVVEVKGTRVKVLVNKDMNHSTLIHNGKVINNITVNGFILIQKGSVQIVGKIDAEYIEDLINNTLSNKKDYRYNKGSILRVLEVQIVGYFENNNYESGVRHLPMIGNLSHIPNQEKINRIYEGSKRKLDDQNDLDESVYLGKSIYENIEVGLSVNKFYASHIGIFGNTGSGKSNTLAKLYYELFSKIGADKIKRHSTFHVIDFNGEYAHEGVFGLPNENLNIINVGSYSGNNKIEIEEKHLLDGDLLSILFNAREQTQKPFIKRLLSRMEYAKEQEWEISTWLKHLYIESLVSSKREIFEYLITVIDSLMKEVDFPDQSIFEDTISKIEWHGIQEKYYVGDIFFDSREKVKINLEVSGFALLEMLCSKLDSENFTWFMDFIINSKLQLIDDLLKRYTQFDHINPLINRIESRINELENTIKIVKTKQPAPLVTVYSFRECSTDIKQMIPPLFIKNTLDDHKNKTDQDNIDQTVHIIIDEAHNILTPQYDREGHDWHDYRLEVFEEIIKEGRKFGFYLTIASQRPSDISTTITSQIHNYFIHRLVNDQDLEMVDNTISTLDRVSKSAIPSLASGSCIVTGTALVMPIFMQVDLIYEKTGRPSSDDINLIQIWGSE